MPSKIALALHLFSIAILAATAEESKESLLPSRETCGHQKTTIEEPTGKSAEIGEYPWVCLLKYVDDQGKAAGFRCVCSLISSRYVLTTAVCASPKEVTLSGVRLGEHDLTTDPDCRDKDKKDCSEPVKDYGVENKTIHAGFDRVAGFNDIALIRLNTTVTFTDSIRPVCLPESETSSAKAGETVTATGWGRSITGDLITIKKKVLGLVLANEECAKDYAKANRTITEEHLCTRSFRNNTAFTCAGDSGGPLMSYSEKRWQQDGIVSFGIGCGFTHADGNTRVAKYLGWIKENVLP